MIKPDSPAHRQAEYVAPTLPDMALAASPPDLYSRHGICGVYRFILAALMMLVGSVSAQAQTVSVGNRVWIDTDSDGVFEFANGELPLDGVLIQLYADVDADGELGAGDGAPIMTQYTSNGGFYRFDGLSDGDYIVEVASSNFLTGGILENFSPTTGDPDPDGNSDTDSNGQQVPAYGVASRAVTLVLGDEPTNDGDDDNNTNLTVDFGFVASGTLSWEAQVSNNQGDKVTLHNGSTGVFIADLFASNTGGLNRPYDITVGPGGYLYVTSSFDHKVVRYNSRTGALVGTFISSGNGLDTPSGITFGPDGHCYISSRNSNQVKRYNGNTGAFMDNFISSGLNQPFQGLLWSPDNKLYVGNYGSGLIQRYDTSGALIDSIALPGGVLTVRGFAFGPDGNLYVVAHDNIVYKVTTGTTMTISTFATSSGAFGGINFGPDGHIYVSDIMQNNIRKINGTTGADMGVWSSGGSLGEPEEVIFLPRASAPLLTDYGDYPGFSSASQYASAHVRIGTSGTDTEAANPASGAANADDTTGTDDEDLVMPTFTAGSTTSLVVPVTVDTSQLANNVARIRAYVDWNGDGDVSDSNESLSSQTVSTNGSSNVTFNLTPPFGISAGTKYLRLRISESTASLSFSGDATLKGEVEDYAVVVVAPQSDFGDHASLSSASSLSSNVLRTGATVDGETAATTNATATGDDTTDSDDEDGATVPVNVYQATAASISVNVTNLSGGTAYLNAWVDYDGDGDLGDVGEQIATNTSVSNGTNGGTVVINFTPPAAATTGPAAVRVRLTSVSTPGPYGADGYGEVEDYTTTINPAQMSIGNLIWNDINSNGVKDAAETGVSGALVQLFSPGADNAVGGTGADADTQVGSDYTTTSSGGYGFSNLLPGNYYVKVTPSSIWMTGGTPATADNNVNNNNDGVQPGGLGTPLYSPVITLSSGGEPITDGDTNANTNLTVDFGLFSGMTLGNLVFNDVNNDGVYQSATETGISGLAVELLNGAGESFSPAVTTTTSVGGVYSFRVYANGTYRVRVTPNSNYPVGSSTMGSDNATDNTNDGVQTGLAGSPSTSFAFTLTAGAEPGGSGTTSTENTIDFGFRSGAPTVNPTSLTPPVAGAAYSATVTASPAGGVLAEYFSGKSFATPLMTRQEASINYDWATGSPHPSVPSDGFSVRWTGNIVATTSGSYTFETRTDDGVRLWVNNVLVINEWKDHAPTNYTATVTLTAGEVIPIKMEYYESTGGAVARLRWSGPSFALTPVTAWLNTWTVSSGSLPSWATFNPVTQTLSGTPTSLTPATFTLRTTDALGVHGSGSYTLTPVCPALTVSADTASPLGLVEDTAMSTPVTFTASGGIGAYNWSIVGTLPAGLALNNAVTANTATITGTPTAVGSSTFTVRATDSIGCPKDLSYTIVVACPVLTVSPAALGPFTQYAPTSGPTMSVAGGRSPYSWSATGLPTGLSMSSGGVISGNPTAAPGAYNANVTVTDKDGCTGSRAYTITISCPAVSITTASIPDGKMNDPYVGATLAATTLGTSVPAQTYTWSVTPALPPGLSLSAAGVISGTPTVVTPTTPYTFTAVNQDGCQGTKVLSFATTCPTHVFMPASLPSGIVGTAYSATVTASNGLTPYVYSVSSGSLPPGLSLNPATGEISGIPTAMSVYNFTVSITDGYSCPGTRAYTIATNCPVITVSPNNVAAPVVQNTPYTETLTTSGGSAPYVWSLSVGSLPPGLTLSSGGVISGTPTATGSYSFTAMATDKFGCTGSKAYVMNVIALSVGDLLWVDTDGDGMKDATESGIPCVTLQLWNAGPNTLVENGSGDDIKIGADQITDIYGNYKFSGVPTGANYYVRIPVPPVYFPSAAVNAVNADNGINDDNNSVQVGGAGSPVSSPVFAVAPGGEPATSVDGDDTNGDLTFDFGFAVPDLAYASSVLENPSFEFNGLPNTTGSPFASMGYNGTWTSFGAGMNSLRWVGGVNPTTPMNAPIAHMQVLVAGFGSKVSWVESSKAHHGKRYLLLDNTNSCVTAKASGGGAWSTVLQAGRAYQMAVWADTASAAPASFMVDLSAGAKIIEIVNGPAPGTYQYYSAYMNRFTGPKTSFSPMDYNGWTEATSSSTKPNWRKFVMNFRIAATATAAQIDKFCLTFSASPTSGPVAIDDMYVSPVGVTIGNLVWNDANNNGQKDPVEMGLGGARVQLYNDANNNGIESSDPQVGADYLTTVTGGYGFQNLPPGKYYVKVTPPAGYALSSGTPDTADNNEDNDNNGAQPGGVGGPLFSPVIDLQTGAEPVSEDGNANTNMTVDFGLFTGISLGNIVWNDSNTNGLFDSASETGIGGLTVELLNAAGASFSPPVVTSTNSSGNYGFMVYTPGSYRVRVIPNTTYPLATTYVNSDNGVNDDSNGGQSGGSGTPAMSPVITLTAGAEPGTAGTTNTEHTVDFGFRSCPVITISPVTMAGGTQFTSYPDTAVAASGGFAPYTFSLASGSLPGGMGLSSAGLISGTPTAAPGTYPFTVRATDAVGCTGTFSYTLVISCPTITLTQPSPLPDANKGVAFNHTLAASGGAAPYSFDLTSGALPPGLSLSGTGLISGTPDAGGTYNFTVRARDANLCENSKAYSITVLAISVGNLVWNDENQNGTFDVGESGIDGVSLQIFQTTDNVIGNADDVPRATTSTAGGGFYAFTGLNPAKYFIRIATPPSAYSYSSGMQVDLDNGFDGDNNGIQAGGKGTEIVSPVFTLATGTEPGSTGVTDTDGTVDFALRAVPNPVETLLEYDLNTTSSGLPAPPSLKDVAVVSAAKLQTEDDLSGLTDITEPTTNGPMRTGSLSRMMRDWDTVYDSSLEAVRTNLMQHQDSLWVRFDLNPTTTGNIGNIYFDVMRSGSNSPVQGRAFLTWRDGAVYKTAWTDVITVSSTEAWHSADLPWTGFNNGATGLPTGAQLAGKSFLLELYFWGGDQTGHLTVDNVMLGGSVTTPTPSLSIGDFVWADLNNNGLKNSREPGLPGVPVELWLAGADNLANTGDDSLVSSSTTDGNGYYLFFGLTNGKYFIKLPSLLPDYQLTSGTPDTADNGQDNDNNGIQPGGTGTFVHSPVVELLLNSEPGASGSGNAEMTVDFGFAPSLTIGNLVWSDTDNDGAADPDESGVSGATVSLYSTTDTTVGNGDDLFVESMVTASGGAYSFDGLGAGKYYLRVTPPATHPSRSAVSVSADNGVDGDSNGVSQTGIGADIYSPVITLTGLGEPGSSTVPFGLNTDNTVDFGLRPAFVSVGNLVFKDNDNDGAYDPGEGVSGVRVELLDENGIFVNFTTTSASPQGAYAFTGLLPGNYYVRIPASEFAAGQPLNNLISIAPASPLDDSLDDNSTTGDSGLDNASPASNGIVSPLLALFNDACPTGEPGFENAMDDVDDNNANLSVDFGFKTAPAPTAGYFCFAFGDTAHNGSLLPGATCCTPVQPYDFNYSAGIAYVDNFSMLYDASLQRLKLDATFSQFAGRKVDAFWLTVSTGSYPRTSDQAVLYFDGFDRDAPQITIYKYDATHGAASWQNPAQIMLSSAPGGDHAEKVLLKRATETGSEVRFEFVVDVSVVNDAVNWPAYSLNSATWQGLVYGNNAALSLGFADLGSAPAYNAAGKLTSLSYAGGDTGYFETDPAGVNTILTESCPVAPWVDVGNLVWNDVDNDGQKDASEAGLQNRTVQLFNTGADGVVGGAGVNADSQVATTTTSVTGSYSFVNLVPGKYYLRVPVDVALPKSGGVPDPADNGDDDDNNGVQAGGVGTSLQSPVLDLQPGSESITDGDTNANTNLTVDFGLWSGFTIGDLVWRDANNDGVKDVAESGLSNVQVALMDPGADLAVGGTGVNADTQVTDTITNSSGAYDLRVYSPGSYYLRVTPTVAEPLTSSITDLSDNADDGDNNGLQPGGVGNYVTGPVMSLVAGMEPGSSGTGNEDITKDFGLRPCPAINISPASPLTSATQYSAYSQTLTASGAEAPYTWSLVSGALPSGITLSSAGLISGATSAAPTTYNFTVQARDALGCTATKSFALTVLCPNITMDPATLGDATQYVSYSQTFTASGGTSPYAWSITGGALPSGLTQNPATGRLSGTPGVAAAPGVYSFTVQAQDAFGCSVSTNYSLTVLCPAISFSPSSLSNGTVGYSYDQTASVTGGTAPYTYAVSSGALPPGLSLNTSDGRITGTPTTETVATFTLEATDFYGCKGTKAYSITTVCPTISLSPSSFPTAYVTWGYNQTLVATEGTAPYNWTVTSGALPEGLTLSGTGEISGVPTTEGVSNFTVRATDVYGCYASRGYSITVKAMRVGNLVFNDADYDGVKDAAEGGVAGATVQIFSAGADNAIGGSGANADTQIGSDIVTLADGAYLSSALIPGYYYVKVLPPSTHPLSSGSPDVSDNQEDDDNNGVQPGAPDSPVFSPIISVVPASEPSADGDGDNDTDLTVDIGLFVGMNVGNLVWSDLNDNGTVDAGEPGVSGVGLELWNVGPDALIGGEDDMLHATTTSLGGGAYAFTKLRPGNFCVRIATPPATHPLSSSNTDLADNGEDGDDNGQQVAAGPVYCPPFTLTPQQEPGATGTGYTENTIDFGLLNVTPAVFVSATHDDGVQVFDPSDGHFCGSLVHPFGASHSQGNGDWGDLPYSIEQGPDGNWYVAHYGASNIRKISPDGVDLGLALVNTPNISLLPVFTFGPDGNFYVVDGNGNRIVRFCGPGSATPGQPMGSAPYTFIAQGGVQDINFGPDGNIYLAIQNGSLREVRRYNAVTGSFMNTIVNDTQLVNLVPGGQSIALVGGVDIAGNILYGVNKSDGEVFSINLSNPWTPGAPQLVADIDGSGVGAVDARDLEVNPMDGLLYVTGYSWSRPITAGSFASSAIVTVNPAGAPNGIVRAYEVPIPTPPGPNNEIWPGPRDLTFGKFVCPPADKVGIGSLVWHDMDANGQVHPSEPGIAGVKVELWKDGDGNVSNGVEQLVGWTYTDSNGLYYFSGQAGGDYQLVIPASNFAETSSLHDYGYSSPVTSTSDNGVDNNDSGLQVARNMETRSPIIHLEAGTEPAGNAITGAESGRGGDIDDFVVDANADMTVDFGFVAPGELGIGNLVFDDMNGNGRYDSGEGVDGITVKLFRPGDNVDTDLPLRTAVTAGGGKYLFDSIWEGQYFLHIPASQFGSSGLMRGSFSSPGVQSGDDDAGEDTIDEPQPWITGLSTGTITLVEDSLPLNSTSETGFDHASDDARDSYTDLTIDLGTYRPVSIGNLVFNDLNTDGRYNTGEGVDGVTLELYKATQVIGTDTPVATTTSAGGGKYLFSELRPGIYRVHIPAANFLAGGALQSMVSVADGLAGDDDVGENGVNSASPSTTGVSSNFVTLFPGQTPTDLNGETGFDNTSDNDLDAAVDLTVDFGFQNPVGIGNLVFLDQNENGHFDTGEGLDGVKVDLYRQGQTPGYSQPIFTRTTSGGGRYLFDYLPSGTYIVHIPATEFGPGKILEGAVSLTGVQISGDDDNGEDGLDESTPSFNGVRGSAIYLGNNTAPVNGGDETGAFNTDDDVDDNNFDLTMDFGFGAADPNSVGIGNLVFRDQNGNRVHDEGEGAEGVVLQLYVDGDVPGVDAPVQTTLSASGGTYYFAGLAAGQYFVHIPASEFASGKPLHTWKSIPAHGADNRVDDNADENGVDTSDPSITGISTTVITLFPDDEPTDGGTELGHAPYLDSADDNNSDLTVDFGFYSPVGIGNLVFIDANLNGRADVGEGVGGITVELYEEGTLPGFDPPLQSTTTTSTGNYAFTYLEPGNYFIHINASQFADGAPLHEHVSMADTHAGDDDAGEDGVDESQPMINGVSTDIVTLGSGVEPSGTQESGLGGGDDDATDTHYDFTIDLGFAKRVSVGNLVFADLDRDGKFDPETEQGLDNVTVELWRDSNTSAPAATTTTANGGIYSFGVAPGSYHVRIPSSEFASGGELANMTSSPGAASPGSTSGDDDLGEDGIDVSNMATNGVRTASFTLAAGTEPASMDEETGHLADADDLDDLDSDLTVDLGFVAKPLGVGNLVFRDLNSDGIYTSGTDVGVAGVLVQLYVVGQAPGLDPPVAETLTGPDGTFLLQAFVESNYFIHIPSTMFMPGGPLEGTACVPGYGADDDRLDDEFGEDGFDAVNPAATGVNSVVFILNYGQEATDSFGETGYGHDRDNADDADMDLTVDLGFTGGVTPPQTLGVGNLVFLDANADGVAQASEGIGGVLVQLFADGDDPAQDQPLAVTMTGNTGTTQGRYFFGDLPAGAYFVHLPALNFQQGAPLYRKISVLSMATGTGSPQDDQLSEDGGDTQNPEVTGVSSGLVLLQIGACPVGAVEGGVDGTTDDASDGNTDLTVDFGFVTRLGLGNLVFSDSNADGSFTPGVENGVPGVLVEAVRMNGSAEVAVVASSLTGTDGRYLLWVQPGFSYKLRIPASEFGVGAPLSGLTGSEITGSGYDDSHNQDALPSANPLAYGVSTAVQVLTLGAQPTDADNRETGYGKTSDNSEDSNVNLTFDLGFRAQSVGVGNLVFHDMNNNGHYDAGEGVDGVWMLLLDAGAVGTGNITPVASTYTANGGRYIFENLQPGNYVVHVAADNFKQNISINGGAQGPGPLYGKVSLFQSGPGDGHIDDHADEDGIDSGTPELNGISSGPINLALNDEPTDANTELGAFNTMDNASDANVDLTVDFGFRTPPPPQNLKIGNMVFWDYNGSGGYDAGEGIGGVTVKLFQAGADPLTSEAVATVTTAATGTAAGSYLFENLTPGNYFVFLPPSNFVTDAPLYRRISLLGHQGGAFQVYAGDDNLGEDGLDEQQPEITGVRSSMVSVVAGGAPTGSGEAGYDGTGDDAADADVNLTVDFGFRTRLGFGNLVFRDMDANGYFNSPYDVPVDGILVELVKMSGSTELGVAGTAITSFGGRYVIYATPGQYKLRIPASQFANGELKVYVPTITTGTGYDDDANQDGIFTATPEANGVSTPTYSFAHGAQPTETDGRETGYLNNMDPGEDHQVNLTLDFGFVPEGLGVGNLVFKDVNSNSKYDAGLDQPLAGVTLKLFAAGANVGIDSPVSTTQSAIDGSYFLSAPAPGNYFVHVTASNFQSVNNGPLLGLKASEVSGSSTADYDDNTDQNALNVSSPSINGISTGVFTLAKNAMPVNGTGGIQAETGYQNTMDDVADRWANMTIDLGFEVAPQGFPLAGRVRRDLTGAGSAGQAGAPLQGVEVALYSDKDGDGEISGNEVGAVATTTTNENGEYTFSGVEPGEYVVVQSPLPGATLTFDTDGGDAATTNVEIADQPASNVDFMQSLSPDSFTQWQQTHTLGGSNAATDNPDGDLYDNLLEYALGTDAASGLSQRAFALEVNEPSGSIDALLTRRAGGHLDMAYKLEFASSLEAPARWAALSITPSITGREDGTQILRFADLESAAPGAGMGFVRLKVSLDADQNGSPEAVSYSPVFGFARQTFATGQRTFSMPLLGTEVFSGKAIAVSGGIISLALGSGSVRDQFKEGMSYYIEVLDGPRAGHRFEVDEAASGDLSVAVDAASPLNTLASPPASLAGARVVIRPHWTLGTLFTPASFRGGNTPTTADRLQFFDNATNQFQTFWLHAARNTARWVADATLAARDGRVVAPGEGVLVHVRGDAVNLPLVGQVRETAFVMPLKAGAQLTGSGFPVAMSPVDRGYSVEKGFTSSESVGTADRIRLWLGDEVSGGTGYITRFLHGSATGAKWVREGDATLSDEGDVKLLQPFHASFVSTSTAKPEHVEQVP
jgi:hypothetical protein